MICTDDQIKSIVTANPNKELISFGIKQADILIRNIHGINAQDKLNKIDYFESPEIYNERKTGSVSNKDLFSRLFQKEDMVFTAVGGMCYYDGLSEGQTKVLNSKLDAIRFGNSMRKWVQNFALLAYRSDPMGLLMIERDKENNPYPVYKSIYSVFDYLPKGRGLEYVCFRLKKSDLGKYDIDKSEIDSINDNEKVPYFRLIDDAKDIIIKSKDNTVTIVNQIKNIFQKVPALIASDIFSYNDVNKFISPADPIIELATCYHRDRSIRDLVKLFCGYPKTIEPLLDCGTCQGTGFVGSYPCPDCTPAGGDHGTGKKLRTKVSDTARFSLETLKDGFSWERIFGYSVLPVEILNKLDSSLVDQENLIHDIYWGTNQTNTKGPKVGSSNIEETATKTLANLQPVYARLNKTADWAESTENSLIDFIGKITFGDAFKKSNNTYGRYYILETPYTLMEEYLDSKQKGLSQSALNELLKKYYHALYKDNPIQLGIMIKLMDVEPWVHNTISEVQGFEVSESDYLMKVYFNDWLATKTQGDLFATDAKTLKGDLLKFAEEKQTLLKSNPSVVSQQKQNLAPAIMKPSTIELQDQK